MGHSIYWRQERAFGPAEWKLISRQATRMVGEATAAGVLLAANLSQPDRISFNGVGEERAEPFTLTRELRPLLNWEEPGDERDNWCKTHAMPYGRCAEGLLRFAARLAPEALSVGADPTEAETYRQQHEEASALAVQTFLEHPGARLEEVVQTISEAVGLDAVPSRQIVREVRQAVVDVRFAPYLFSDGPLHLELTVESGDVEADYSRTETHLVNSPAEALNAMFRYVAVHGLEEQSQTSAAGRLFRQPGQLREESLGTLHQDGTIVVLCPEVLDRYAETVHQFDPYVPTVDPELARQECAATAESVFQEEESTDLNALVKTLASRTHADPVVARAVVEDVHRTVVNVRPLTEELRRGKALACALQDGLRSNGSPLHETSYPVGRGNPPRLEHHFGTLLARAGGEWEVAFVAAERALSDPEGFYRLAAGAAERELEDGPDEYPCVLYRQEQAKRASVHLLLGSFARWQGAAATFSRVLAGLVADDSPCRMLAAYLHGNGFDPGENNPSPTLAQAVGALAKEAAVIQIFKVGAAREVARDYLNLLEVANDLGLEPVTETAVFRELNRVARGSDRTAAQEIEDFTLERDGAAMLGEAHVTEGVHGVEGSAGQRLVEWDAYTGGEDAAMQEPASPRRTGGGRGR